MERAASFLDHNAGAPVTRELWRSVEAELFASPEESARAWNPSGVHSSGRRAKQLLRRARERVVRSWGIDPSHGVAFSERLIFTSSGTEANQMVIRSQVRAATTPWFYSADHHDSVLALRELLPNQGTAIPVDRDGQLCQSNLTEQLSRLSVTEIPPVFALLWVNNETGVVQEREQIEKLIFARFPRAIVLWDAVQAWGKEPVLKALQAASVERQLYFSFSGHKIGAFPGVGALLVPPGAPALLPVVAGKQERAQRGGTESLSAIVSLGLAAQRMGSLADQADALSRLAEMQRKFEATILARCPTVQITASGTKRAAQTTHLRLPGVRGDALLSELDLLGFEVSTGAACQAGLAEPSRVLLSMGFSEEEARSALRISFGVQTPPEELERFGEALENCLRLRENPRA